MDQRIRNLWVRALCGSSAAYRKLGMIFLTGKLCRRDRLLARLCLEKAVEMGDEEGYFLYHKAFSKGDKVIDDQSFAEMCRDYRETGNLREKKRLEKYIVLVKWKKVSKSCKKE